MALLQLKTRLSSTQLPGSLSLTYNFKQKTRRKRKNKNEVKETEPETVKIDTSFSSKKSISKITVRSLKGDLADDYAIVKNPNNIFEYSFEAGNSSYLRVPTQNNPTQRKMRSLGGKALKLLFDYCEDDLMPLYKLSQVTRDMVVNKFKTYGNQLVKNFTRKYFDILMVTDKSIRIQAEGKLTASLLFECMIIGRRQNLNKTVSVTYISDNQFADSMSFDLVPEDKQSKLWIMKDEQLVFV